MMTQAYDLALALLRVVTGFIVWQHGAQTIFGMFGGAPAEALTMSWLRGNVEVFG